MNCPDQVPLPNNWPGHDVLMAILRAAMLQVGQPLMDAFWAQTEATAAQL
ncbi:hypothetical protein [Synechocystis sp. PCC 6714]|nr:hypothetical protein [Synechocystis sp. PCC 6714]AIE73569.1 hypothetical protein D082_10410 [Synechocystis sp. PCC 6714]